MRIVFMGTPEFAVPSLRALLENGYNVVGIYDKSEPEQEELKKTVDIYINNYCELDVL